MRQLWLALVWIGLSCAGPPRELLIASDATFAPFHYVDDSGRATGFELELARLVAERAGYAPEVRIVEYDSLLPGVLSGDHDFVAATTGITDERRRAYAFSRSYFATCQAALVRTGDGEPQELAELEGRRVGAAGAGTSILALAGLEGVKAVELAKGQASVPSVLDRTIDALVVDEYDAVQAARESEGRLRVLSEPVALERYAFVLAPERDELRRELDAALAQLELEGVLDELMARFGVARDEDWPVTLPR